MKQVLLFVLIYGTAVLITELDLRIVPVVLLICFVYLCGLIDGIVTGAGKEEVAGMMLDLWNWVRGKR